MARNRNSTAESHSAHPGTRGGRTDFETTPQGGVAYDVSPTGAVNRTLNTVGNRFGLLPYGGVSTIPGLPNVVP